MIAHRHPSIFHLSFLLSLYADHRDLHSFPTRRSSDLNAACSAALAGCGKGKDAENLDDKEYTWLRGQSLDRKSTRLNSSHTVISYAVFCLKKKILQVTVSGAVLPASDSTSSSFRTSII